MRHQAIFWTCTQNFSRLRRSKFLILQYISTTNTRRRENLGLPRAPFTLVTPLRATVWVYIFYCPFVCPCPSSFLNWYCAAPGLATVVWPSRSLKTLVLLTPHIQYIPPFVIKTKQIHATTFRMVPGGSLNLLGLILTHQVVMIFTNGVRPSEKQHAATLTLQSGKQNTRYNGHHECKHDHLLAVARWVILNSPDL